VYRFLLTPRWLAAAALAVAASIVMVFLGNWQLHRYEERSAINDRIDAADSGTAVPLTSVMAAPTAPGSAGPSPGKNVAWTKITMTGSYDPAHEIQVRGRTVNGNVGFEIVTPLILPDRTAVLVDRGWIPPGAGGTALAAPTVPAAPTGQVTVVGKVHLSESRPTAIERRDGRLDTRRIAVPHLAKEMPFPVYGAYVLLTAQTPANDPTFQQIPIDHEDAWQNAGYTVQWWLFALMALFAFGWQARKEAHGEGVEDGTRMSPDRRPDRRAAGSGDRVADYDRRAAAAAAADAGDRVAEHDRRAAAAAAAGDRVAEHRRRAAAAARDRVAEHDRRAARSGDRAAEHDRRAARSGDRVADFDRVTEADRLVAEKLAATNPDAPATPAPPKDSPAIPGTRQPT
jgi:cytochrome oxidase assembly protein ShyY1